MFDRILIQRAEAVTKTKGGIVIPEKAQEKVLKGTVVAVGPGYRTEVCSALRNVVMICNQLFYVLPHRKETLFQLL